MSGLHESMWLNQPPLTKFKLVRNERRALEKLRRGAKDKLEYARAQLGWEGACLEDAPRLSRLSVNNERSEIVAT